MKKILCLLIFFLLFSGCGSKPTPGWIGAGNQQLESFKNRFLTDEQPAVAERHFQRAVEEIKKSGDLDLLGKAWLTRMALQCALLVKMEEGEYGRIAVVHPVPANRNFYLFLAGDPATVDGTLLPEQYRPFLDALREGSLARVEKAIAAIQEDPLSRLIAAGLAARRGLENEAILQAAVSTASHNGWKRALLVWMGRLQTYYEAAGDSAKAAAVRRHIELIER